ncbi:MAG: DUF116 domain-containing protein [Oscillospiraceae bacterium]|nr:DUF116 domain-containing protein [Oscillospiraceae bacterium]
MSKHTDNKQRIRIYMFLAVLSVLALALAATVFILLDLNRNTLVSTIITIVFMVLAVLFVLLCAVALSALGYYIITNRPAGPVGRFLIRVVTRLYPIVLWIGRKLNISADRIRGSFIQINNHLVAAYDLAVPPERILVLLPHCLQNTECSRKITGTIENCADYGRCDIGRIKRICSELGVRAIVATGGTVARQAAKEIKPLVGVAVACERDLFYGIMDVAPLPVFGVANTRPEGPCHNTRVDTEAFRQTLEALIHGEKPEVLI